MIVQELFVEEALAIYLLIDLTFAILKCAISSILRKSCLAALCWIIAVSRREHSSSLIQLVR